MSRLLPTHAPIPALSASHHDQAPAPLVAGDPRQRATVGLDLLTAEQLDAFGAELDALRQRVLDELGQADADYIRRTMRVQRGLDVAGRVVLFLPLFAGAWAWPVLGLGVALLAVAKILENMEVGHNVMHGQYDWMNDPMLDGHRYEWDIVAPSEDWRYYHNYLHHTYTNIHGMDRDIGYGHLRVDDAQPWQPRHRFNLPVAFVLMLFFEWGVMKHGILFDAARGERIDGPEYAARKARALGKIRRQVVKDYVLYPLLALPLVPFAGWWAPVAVLAGNVVANLVRNIWTFLVIFCGHFPAEVSSFEFAEAANESRGQWYLRQLLGSANISGSPLLHVLTGNLSHQIEHHLYPDIPARRYREIAVEVRAIVARYGLRYNTGRMSRQVASVARQLAKYSRKPNDPLLIAPR